MCDVRISFRPPFAYDKETLIEPYKYRHIHVGEDKRDTKAEFIRPLLQPLKTGVFYGPLDGSVKEQWMFKLSPNLCLSTL